MKIPFIGGSLLLTIACVGCASAPLSDGGRRVRLVATTPNHCKYVSQITGSYKGDSVSFGVVVHTVEFARNDLKNQAAKLGANTVEIIEGKDTDRPIGEAYKCED